MSTKPVVGDNVAVVRPHTDTDTPFIVVSGTLECLGRGKKTTDKRAWAEEGAVAGMEDTEEAKGWALVRDEEGTLFSYPEKQVKLLHQRVIQQHEQTMAVVSLIEEARSFAEQFDEAAILACAALGLDTSTLTQENAHKVCALLRG